MSLNITPTRSPLHVWLIFLVDDVTSPLNQIHGQPTARFARISHLGVGLAMCLYIHTLSHNTLAGKPGRLCEPIWLGVTISVATNSTRQAKVRILRNCVGGTCTWPRLQVGSKGGDEKATHSVRVDSTRRFCAFDPITTRAISAGSVYWVLCGVN